MSYKQHPLDLKKLNMANDSTVDAMLADLEGKSLSESTWSQHFVAEGAKRSFWSEHFVAEGLKRSFWGEHFVAEGKTVSSL